MSAVFGDQLQGDVFGHPPVSIFTHQYGCLDKFNHPSLDGVPLHIFDKRHHARTVKNNKSRLVIVSVWVVVGYKYSACRFKGLPLWRRWIYFGSVELG